MGILNQKLLLGHIFRLLFIPMLFVVYPVFANKQDKQENKPFIPDRVALGLVLEMLPIDDVESLAMTSKDLREQIHRLGFVFEQVEIESLSQLLSEFPKSKLLNVKFHPDISKRDLFECLNGEKIVGKVDAQQVTALSELEKQEVENGLVMTLPIEMTRGEVFYTPDGKTIVDGSPDQEIRLWSTSTGEIKHTLRPMFDRRFHSSLKVSKDSQFILGSVRK